MTPLCLHLRLYNVVQATKLNFNSFQHYNNKCKKAYRFKTLCNDDTIILTTKTANAAFLYTDLEINSCLSVCKLNTFGRKFEI